MSRPRCIGLVHTRRRAIAMVAAAGVGASGIGARAAAAATADTQRLLIGFPPGPFDAICRAIAAAMSEPGGRVVTVDSRQGAAGRLAAIALREAPADGTVFLVTPASVMTVYPHIHRRLGYDPLVDFAPVAAVAHTHFALLCGPSVPAEVDSVESFGAWCRGAARPISCGNPGAGSLPHFLSLLLADDARLPLQHVPFRGSVPAMQAVAGGQIDCAIGTEAAAGALLETGRVRLIATTGAARGARWPTVPTFRELGYARLEQREWFGAFLPARASADVVVALADRLASALAQPPLREAIVRSGFVPDATDPRRLRDALHRELAFWGPVVRASGFTAES